MTAQTYFVLHRFNGYNDGATPFELLLSSNVLYGTAGNTGHFNWGTVFKINTDGTGFTNLYNFTGGSDGGGPTCGLALSSNTLYGTTYYHGGSWGSPGHGRLVLSVLVANHAVDSELANAVEDLGMIG